jgi:hypothetical protein
MMRRWSRHNAAPPVLAARDVWCRDCCADAPGRSAARAIRGVRVRQVSGNLDIAQRSDEPRVHPPLDYPASSGLDPGSSSDFASRASHEARGFSYPPSMCPGRPLDFGCCAGSKWQDLSSSPLGGMPGPENARFHLAGFPPFLPPSPPPFLPPVTDRGGRDPLLRLVEGSGSGDPEQPPRRAST